MKKIPILYHDRMSKFDFGMGHPFRGERFGSFIKLFKELHLDENPLFTIVEPEMAREEDLETVHLRDYIDEVKVLERQGGFLSLDTFVTPGMVDAAKLIVGASMEAGRLIMNEDHDTSITFGGFHHAGVANGEGFCVFNDVAITVRMLLDNYNVKKILIMDTDAHQGNGTMDIFYDDPRVLFISIHQDPRTLYPGRGFAREAGSGEGEGFTVNIPMPMFSGNEQYEFALNEILVPLAREFEPQVIIQNGGSDPHFADELTLLGMDLNGLSMMGGVVKRAADETSGKLVSMIVSGYGDLAAYGWLALIAGVSGLTLDLHKISFEGQKVKPAQVELKEESLQRKVGKVVAEVKDVHRKYWKCFN